MSSLLTELNKNLVEKYSYGAFMYTEYPHKSFWSKKFDEGHFRAALKLLFSKKSSTPLLLYVHMPYCPSQCYYCTCHTLITADYRKVKRYLGFLFKEIDLLRDFFQKNSITPNFCEIHLGGGSPTFISEPEFEQLIDKIRTIADIGNISEFTIEIDPRRVTKERVKYYHTKGIKRISFGVQDFDLNVQKAVNRVQPPELIENLLTPDIRGCFEKGVNFDVLCGLPLQTRDSMKRTFERIVKMSPERICLNYLHYSSKFAKHQDIMFDGRCGRPSSLPGVYERKMLFLEALNILLKNGYVRTGYDHFTKPQDDIAEAMRKKKMRWNALGVTAGRYMDVLGIGLHSWSTLGEYYFQNVFDLSDYEALLESGKFPILRGHKLSKDDLIRREVIQTLRNLFVLDFAEDIKKKYNINFKEYFQKEIAALDKFIRDGLAQVSDSSIKITEVGRQFVDIICKEFDSYASKP